jgi:hypothetical protein
MNTALLVASRAPTGFDIARVTVAQIYLPVALKAD